MCVALSFVLFVVLNIGPVLALCFYWAAVQCKTNAFSIALPHVGDAATSVQHSKLSRTNCPSTFVPLMNLWSDIVPRIQHLAAERKHKLLLVICGRGPPIPPPVVTVLSEKLRSIAIKMSQLQSFQDRVKVSSIYTPPMPPSETSNAKGNPKMDPTIEPIRETLPPTIADVPESTRHLLDPAASALRLRSRLAHLSQTTWMGAVI